MESLDRDIALDQIAEAMSRELHKTAQPLTIVQGSLELLLARVTAGDECRDLLKRASEQVPRLASCLEDVRSLAALHRPAHDITNFSLSALVTDVMQSLRGDLEIAGITIVLDAQPDENTMTTVVNTSPTRTFTGVRLVMSALADCLPAGGQIKMSIERDGTNLAIKVWPSRHSRLEGEDLLGTLTSKLEFAQLLFASLGGRLVLSQNPAVVVISLPAAAAQPVAENSHRRAANV